MRFLLINPYSPISETASPSLGLAFIAGALERIGVEVRILDFVVFPYTREIMESVLKEFKPDFVGVTAVTIAFDSAMEVIRDVKAADPDILTVMGGPHVSFCARETMQAFPEIDFIVVREGEETVTELVRATEKDRRWDGIKGLVYRDGSEIIQTEDRGYVQDVEALPSPARHLLPLGRYRALNLGITMTSSRGCPFRCIFCVGRQMVGQKVRYWSPTHVVDELEQLAALNFIQISIADDLFTANKSHCHAVCDEIIRRGIKTTWATFARVDTVTEELLAKMKAAGCNGLLFGVESANAEILKIIDKRITTEQVENAARICTDAGITPCMSFILGLPGETPESIRESQAFGEKLKSLGAMYGFHFLAPFPGTKVREENESYGLKILSNDWKEYHANRAIVETEFASQAMLNEVADQWDNEIKKYYDELRQSCERGDASEEAKSAIRGMDRSAIIHDLMMKQVIENTGTWISENGSQAKAFEMLVDRIAKSTDVKFDPLFDALQHAVQHDNLKCTVENDRVRWDWNDYLEI